MINQHEISAIDRFWEVNFLNILLKPLFDWVVYFGIRSILELGNFLKLPNLKIFEKSHFLKNQNPHNFFVFQTTESIHTYLKSSHQTGIISWGQNFDIATGLGPRAPFSLYWGTHCNIQSGVSSTCWMDEKELCQFLIYILVPLQSPSVQTSWRKTFCVSGKKEKRLGKEDSLGIVVEQESVKLLLQIKRGHALPVQLGPCCTTTT